MASPHDDELSHPLEQVTGEKDVPPEDEQGTPSHEESEPDQDASTDRTQDAADEPTKGFT
ncbi:hypothetical protein [Streptomyces sp. NPDC057052]|uniref:hypothetical protein n=1 Tax=Streptomyces sp. NPDC057052 TaxID=3346010 RepID=UPI003641586F